MSAIKLLVIWIFLVSISYVSVIQFPIIVPILQTLKYLLTEATCYVQSIFFLAQYNFSANNDHHRLLVGNAKRQHQEDASFYLWANYSRYALGVDAGQRDGTFMADHIVNGPNKLPSGDEGTCTFICSHFWKPSVESCFVSNMECQWEKLHLASQEAGQIGIRRQVKNMGVHSRVMRSVCAGSQCHGYHPTQR